MPSIVDINRALQFKEAKFEEWKKSTEVYLNQLKKLLRADVSWEHFIDWADEYSMPSKNMEEIKAEIKIMSRDSAKKLLHRIYFTTVVNIDNERLGYILSNSNNVKPESRMFVQNQAIENILDSDDSFPTHIYLDQLMKYTSAEDLLDKSRMWSEIVSYLILGT